MISFMNDTCTEIKNQINRIEGQIKGIKGMIDEGRDSIEIVQQISAVKAALSRLAVEVLKDESKTCLNIQTPKSNEERIKKFEELVTNFFKMT